MPKVYLSPAYHRFNPCAVEGCDETTHNNLYLDALEPFLTACGIDRQRGPRRTPKSEEDGTALMRLLLRSLARNESTTATKKKLLSDIKDIDDETIDAD